MREVKLSKVSEAEIQVLQSELFEYSQLQQYGFNYWSNEEYYNALLKVDIAQKLWYSFRKKIEAEAKQFTMRLKVNEAIILLYCCHWERSGRSDYERHVAEKYKGLIDQQLKSVNGIAAVAHQQQ